MKKLSVIITAIAVCACMLLAGCSKGYDSSAKEGYNYSPAYDSPAYEGAEQPASQDGEAAVLENRKIIKNADMRVQTLEFDAFLASVNSRINELGGYVESSEVNGRSYYAGKSLRYARITARIPADKLEDFLSAVQEAGNVTSLSRGVSDVTEKYVDIEARLASVRTEYDTLLELLSKAGDLSEIIMLQDRLTDVRYEMEAYESSLRNYDSLIDMSTVTMSIDEVERETAVEEESFGKEASRRFSESLEDVGEAFRSFALWFVGNLPAIIAVLAIFVALPLIIIALCRRKAKKRAQRRMMLAELENESRKPNSENGAE